MDACLQAIFNPSGSGGKFQTSKSSHLKAISWESKDRFKSVHLVKCMKYHLSNSHRMYIWNHWYVFVIEFIDCGFPLRGALCSALVRQSPPALGGVSVMIDEPLRGGVWFWLDSGFHVLCFGIWPSYWTTSLWVSLLPFEAHNCLSLNFPGFHTRLINPYLLCTSEQSLL